MDFFHHHFFALLKGRVYITKLNEASLFIISLVCLRAVDSALIKRFAKSAVRLFGDQKNEHKHGAQNLKNCCLMSAEYS